MPRELDEGRGLGGQILARSEEPLEHLRRDIVERLASGETISAAQEIPFSEAGMRDTPDALIRLLRDDAGLVIARQRREVPTLVVRPTPAGT